MGKNVLIKLIILFLLICMCGCNNSTTVATLEVERAKKDISEINPEAKLSYYRGIIEKIKNQEEVDYLMVSYNRDYYTFKKNNTVFSGNYNLEDNIIIQNHYKNHEINSDNKKKIRKWIEFLNEHNIYGLNKSNREKIRIYLRPNIYLLFIDKNVNQSQLNKIIDNGRDTRGDYFERIAEDVILATERR